MSDFDSDRFIIEFSEMDSLMKIKSDMFLISTVAVSYTHLDVYKRQTGLCSTSIINWSESKSDIIVKVFK